MLVGIVGNGVSGLTAAIKLAEKGFEVYVIGKSVESTNSYLSQAGIALPILDGDSIKAHVIDTIRAGKYLNDEEIVWNVISKSTEAYDFLKSLDLEFKNEIEAGHSFPRVFTIKNETGKHVVKSLYSKAKEVGVQFIKGFASSLAIQNKRCYGVFVNGEFFEFDAVVLAAGGYASLFKYTAGSKYNIGLLLGDAIAKGAIASNLEFVQFHPTGFPTKEGVKLISEAVRGAGARLVNENGERFVNELETRDVVAREVYRQIMHGKKVYLDISGIDDFDEKFPELQRLLVKESVRDLIPVIPVAHYSIGGLRVDAYYRATIKNLYAIGEIADNSFHGANRLASNSILECVVGGLEVARTIRRDKPRGEPETRIRELKDTKMDEEIGDIESIREILWKYAGIVRSGDGLRQGLKELAGIEVDERVRVLARGIMLSALKREESRGCHYREDFPYMRKEFERVMLYAGKGSS